MWKVIIHCSADGWRNYATAFREIADKYPAGTLLSSRKLKGDERRIMEYEFEDANDAEALMQECMTLEGFVAAFEST
ncbi:hypothetical protein C1752_01177 [Acaryochloris thomasi RCC1774]|uniref:Uncharacterized protein n=1 Tax=Acaryochloris thomasi RCC1774 TaxID=1764569 RepID=A0A2W1K365_9CYAN|nr:hypothetical protein [Acaryochloris thomasi]PZD74427.1 hypothetical protein C1752_01177 [Acaryochloris thomasi RCC1774]